MKYKNFEDFLSEKHALQHPEILDDDIPDHYADWCSDLDLNDVIQWADDFAKVQREQLLDLLKASYRALHDPRNPEFDLGGKYFPLARLLENAIAKAEGR